MTGRWSAPSIRTNGRCANVQVVDIVERLNRSTQEQSTADSTVSKVEAILNEHYKTLQWVEAESDCLRRGLFELRSMAPS